MVSNLNLHDIMNPYSSITNMTAKEHDLEHEVYLDPKDHKEHINHGMLEYTEEDLKTSHPYYDEYNNQWLDSIRIKINE